MPKLSTTARGPGSPRPGAATVGQEVAMANEHQPTQPVVCDMTDAPDTATQRMAAYERLFATALSGRERTTNGIRFRFRSSAGIEEWVRDLAAREQACCAFFTFAITRHGDELWWDASVVDDDIARQILNEFFQLPDTVTQGAQIVHDRCIDKGLRVVINDGGTRRPATRADLDLGAE